MNSIRTCKTCSIGFLAGAAWLAGGLFAAGDTHAQPAATTAVTPTAKSTMPGASAPIVTPSKRVPMPNTAAGLAQAAMEPGTVRPESPVVPQISVPLRSTVSDEATRKSPGQIDDRIARCLAEKTKAARERCQRPGSM